MIIDNTCWLFTLCCVHYPEKLGYFIWGKDFAVEFSYSVIFNVRITELELLGKQQQEQLFLGSIWPFKKLKNIKPEELYFVFLKPVKIDCGTSLCVW